MDGSIFDTIVERRVVAILRGVPLAAVSRTAEALLKGGISCVEITFVPGNESKSRDTLSGIQELKKNFGNELLVGAGTVLTETEVAAAVEAGAGYIISPNTDASVIRAAKRLGAVSMPGALTPTEAMAAASAGADIIKLFPAGALGAEYAKAIKGPLSHLTFAAVGGIDIGNMGSFLEAGVKIFGIGGNLVDAKLAAAGEFALIETRARAFAQAAKD